jgi:hypothetical protein
MSRDDDCPSPIADRGHPATAGLPCLRFAVKKSLLRVNPEPTMRLAGGLILLRRRWSNCLAS